MAAAAVVGPSAAFAKLREMYNLPVSPPEQQDQSDDDNDDDDGFRYTGPRTGLGAGSSSVSKYTDRIAQNASRTSGTTSDAIAGNWPSEGDILARASSRSLFSKDWMPMYWVIDDHDLYLYKSKSDFTYHSRGSGFKKRIPITHNLRCLKIHRKDYTGF